MAEEWKQPLGELWVKEFPNAMTKAQICETLINDPDFQGEAAQGAISEFVVRNCKDMAPKKATPAAEKDEDVLSSIKSAEMETVDAELETA